MKDLNTLISLLHDVKGNLAMGDSKNTAGYLKSISLLAGAMSRQHQQDFELDVIEELEELALNAAMTEGLQAKRKLNHRELELCNLEVKLATYVVAASSGCFISSKAAAESLRKIANGIEAQGESELFPRRATVEEVKAWAAREGIECVDADSRKGMSFIDIVMAMKPAYGKKAAKRNSQRA